MNLMDFTYDSVRETVKLLKATGYEFCTLNNCKLHKLPVVLRHDIDISTDKAVKYAHVEAEEGAKSTYYVMVSSELYNPFSRRCVASIKEIRSLGHDIGLHFYEGTYGDRFSEKDVVREKNALEDVIGVAITQVSFHKPSDFVLGSNVKIQGMHNAYDTEEFGYLDYVSDSWHVWKKDLKELIYESNGLQILTHPVWYHERSKSREDSIRELLCSCKYEEYIEDAIFPKGISMKECLNK